MLLHAADPDDSDHRRRSRSDRLCFRCCSFAVGVAPAVAADRSTAVVAAPLLLLLMLLIRNYDELIDRELIGWEAIERPTIRIRD